MSDTQLRGEFDRPSDQVARSSHDELDIIHDLQDLFRSGQEILRPFLHGNAAKEENHLFVFLDAGLFGSFQAASISFYSVIDYFNFVIFNPIATRYDTLGQMADGNDFGGTMEALPFDIINDLIDVFAAAIKFR